MKKLLTTIFLSLLLAAPVEAATPHYGYVPPTVGGSQNAWGTLLNNIFTSIDSNIWSASNGTTIGVNAPVAAGTSIPLSNPVNNIQNISFTGAGNSLILAAANAASSPVVGGTLTVNNVGSYPFSILAQDSSTVLLPSLAAGSTAYLTLTSNSTANGAWQVDTYASVATGNVVIGTSLAVGTTSAAGYALNVQQAGTNQAYFGSTGEFGSHIILDTASSSQGSYIIYSSGGSLKWDAGNTPSSNQYVLYDSVNNKDFLVAIPGGNLVLGPAQTTYIDQSGTLTATLFSGSGASLTSLNASNLASGTVPTAQLGSGTANSTTFLRGDSTWATAASIALRQTFTSSGTWTKPSGTGSNSTTYVQCWGGGGGGSTSSAGGGGGGGYSDKSFATSSLSGTVTVTVGAGGAVGSNGGNTTFDSDLIAYGGSAGSGSTGGAGGGIVGAGAANSAGTFGGGGGASGGDNGANSYYGGGGGASCLFSTPGAAGQSVNGGSGGVPNGAAGSQPGGGGGGTGGGCVGTAGGAGECIVTTWN